MRTRTTTTGVLAVLTLTLTACSSSDSKPETVPSTVTASATPSTAPTLSEDELKQQCSDAIAEAAPGWDDWNYNPGAWQADPRTPEVCQGLADEANPARGNRAFMDALTTGLEMADDPRASQ
ncbi:hypothetical protein [Streptomyces sp. NBRC 110035]|uniref:hypothetical protein n=1 Tax=Streptomyces sp. NBRC 110035 TaxID=1547867 RepID=UPI0005A71AD3|nr:hypothetical protein [Streptomyces sp. NBRC 110035]